MSLATSPTHEQVDQAREYWEGLDYANLKLFCQSLRAHTPDLFWLLEREIAKYGYKPLRGKKFLYASGSLPLLLVAHLDTAHEQPPQSLRYLHTFGALWAQDNRKRQTYLGADDRAGVYVIRKILAAGLRPHVLFTDEEETGCHGAREAAKKLRPQVRFLIQVDRRHHNDCVYYDCPSLAARDYVKAFGYVEANGSFSDIGVLAPAWSVAAVNLSAGYMHEHSRNEYVSLVALQSTAQRVQAMLEAPPPAVIPYRAPGDPKSRREQEEERLANFKKMWEEHRASLTKENHAPPSRQSPSRYLARDARIYLFHHANLRFADLEGLTEKQVEDLAVMYGWDGPKDRAWGQWEK